MKRERQKPKHEVNKSAEKKAIPHEIPESDARHKAKFNQLLDDAVLGVKKK